jgi:hypothetical protein
MLECMEISSPAESAAVDFQARLTSLSPAEQQQYLNQHLQFLRQIALQNGLSMPHEEDTSVPQSSPLEDYYSLQMPEFVNQRLKHLNPSCVQDIIRNFLKQKLRVDVTTLRPEHGDSTVGIIYSPTQNGKSIETVALVWMNFFRYGWASYIFLRSEASEYMSYGKCVCDFNEQLAEYVRAQQADGADMWQDTQAELYFVEYLPLETHSRLQEGHTLRKEEDGGETLRCIMRARLLTPKNLERAWVETELGIILQHFGLDRAGQLNVCVLIDEAQDLYRTLCHTTTQAEKNMFGRDIRAPSSCCFSASTNDSASRS